MGSLISIFRDGLSVQGRPDRVGQPPPALGESGHELVGATAGIGADQGLASAQVFLRQPDQGESGCFYVTGSGVAARVPGPWLGGDRPMPPDRVSGPSTGCAPTWSVTRVCKIASTGVGWSRRNLSP